MSEGRPGVDELLRDALVDCSPEARAAIDQLRGYLAGHQHHLQYAERLAAGQSIGSGQIEGACKNLIGRRLKANSSRRRVRRVNRMAGLCCLMYTHLWKTYWEAP